MCDLAPRIHILPLIGTLAIVRKIFPSYCSGVFLSTCGAAGCFSSVVPLERDPLRKASNPRFLDIHLPHLLGT
jgi:hypothetical protein